MRRIRCVVVARALLLAAVLAGVTSAPGARAAAQEPPGEDTSGADAFTGAASRDGTGGSRGPMLVVLRIAEALHLSDEQTIKVAGEFRRVAQRRRELLAQKASLVSQLESQLGQKPLDDAALTGLTDQLFALEQEILLLPEGLWKAVHPVLTPEQRARLILLRGKMKQQIDGERKRRRAQERAGDGARD